MTSFYSWHGKGQKYGTLSTCIPCCYWKVSKYQLQPNWSWFSMAFQVHEFLGLGQFHM